MKGELRKKVLNSIAAIPRSIRDIAVATGEAETRVGPAIYNMKTLGQVVEVLGKDSHNKTRYVKCDDPTVAAIKKGNANNGVIKRFSNDFSLVIDYVETLEKTNKDLREKNRKLKIAIQAMEV